MKKKCCSYLISQFVLTMMTVQMIMHRACMKSRICHCCPVLQGRSDGGIWVHIPPNSVQVNFLLGKNNARTAIEHEHWSFIPPKKFIPLSPPKKKQISGYAPAVLSMMFQSKWCHSSQASSGRNTSIHHGITMYITKTGFNPNWP